MNRLLTVATAWTLIQGSCSEVTTWPFRHLTPTAERLIRAAALGDTAALAELADPGARDWIARIDRADSMLFRSAAAGMKAAVAAADDSTALVYYRFAYRDTTETLGISFRRRDVGWVVVQVSLPDRM